MTIYFMGGEMGAFTPSDSTVIETTSASRFNAAFARAALSIPAPTAYCQTSALTSHDDSWLHFEHSMATGGHDAAFVTGLEFLTTGGTACVRMRTFDDTSEWKMEYWDGAAWVAAGSTIVVDISAVQTIDINAVVNSATGSITLYVAGTERITSGAIDLSAFADIGSVKFYGRAGTGTERFYSQVIVADEPTIGWRLGTCVPTGAGATSSWTGTFAEIDEAVYSDADFINSTAANQISTFAQTVVPTLTGYNVRAVAVTARARRGASGPQNIRMALRSAGTDYFSGSDIALGLGYAPVQTIWETNPATSAAWVNTAVASLQPGAKSIA